MVCFNPRAHAGRDQPRAGAQQRLRRFNPRAHAGRDGCRPCRCSPRTCFNPRAHAGRDFPHARPSSQNNCFNPRAHAGRDNNVFNDVQFRKDVSIHAPTRGATRFRFLFSPSYHVSIHAPTRGATIYMQLKRHSLLVSIHAPTRGATRSTTARDSIRQRFNPRAHAGRDATETPAESSDMTFQSTRPRGARHQSGA